MPPISAFLPGGKASSSPSKKVPSAVPSLAHHQQLQRADPPSSLRFLKSSEASFLTPSSSQSSTSDFSSTRETLTFTSSSTPFDPDSAASSILLFDKAPSPLKPKQRLTTTPVKVKSTPKDASTPAAVGQNQAASAVVQRSESRSMLQKILQRPFRQHHHSDSDTVPVEHQLSASSSVAASFRSSTNGDDIPAVLPPASQAIAPEYRTTWTAFPPRTPTSTHKRANTSIGGFFLDQTDAAAAADGDADADSQRSFGPSTGQINIVPGAPRKPSIYKLASADVLLSRLGKGKARRYSQQPAAAGVSTLPTQEQEQEQQQQQQRRLREHRRRRTMGGSIGFGISIGGMGLNVVSGGSTEGGAAPLFTPTALFTSSLGRRSTMLFAPGADKACPGADAGVATAATTEAAPASANASPEAAVVPRSPSFTGSTSSSSESADSQLSAIASHPGLASKQRIHTHPHVRTLFAGRREYTEEADTSITSLANATFGSGSGAGAGAGSRSAAAAAPTGVTAGNGTNRGASAGAGSVSLKPGGPAAGGAVTSSAFAAVAAPTGARTQTSMAMATIRKSPSARFSRLLPRSLRSWSSSRLSIASLLPQEAVADEERTMMGSIRVGHGVGIGIAGRYGAVSAAGGPMAAVKVAMTAAAAVLPYSDESSEPSPSPSLSPSCFKIEPLPMPRSSTLYSLHKNAYSDIRRLDSGMDDLHIDLCTQPAHAGHFADPETDPGVEEEKNAMAADLLRDAAQLMLRFNADLENGPLSTGATSIDMLAVHASAPSGHAAAPPSPMLLPQMHAHVTDGLHVVERSKSSQSLLERWLSAHHGSTLARLGRTQKALQRRSTTIGAAREDVAAAGKPAPLAAADIVEDIAGGSTADISLPEPLQTIPSTPKQEQQQRQQQQQKLYAEAEGGIEQLDAMQPSPLDASYHGHEFSSPAYDSRSNISTWLRAVAQANFLERYNLELSLHSSSSAADSDEGEDGGLGTQTASDDGMDEDDDTDSEQDGGAGGHAARVHPTFDAWAAMSPASPAADRQDEGGLIFDGAIGSTDAAAAAAASGVEAQEESLYRGRARSAAVGYRLRAARVRSETPHPARVEVAAAAAMAATGDADNGAVAAATAAAGDDEGEDGGR
ncbi:hypothetical protein OC834_001216 [Tilletia horrida]|nr:hypothetical protein OC834_001216 [Tilletia horrida]